VADDARRLERDHVQSVCQGCLADGILVARLQVETRSCSMRRYFTPSLIVAAALSQPLTAFAQDACPPGAWFCQANDAAAPSTDVAAPNTDALPPPPQADSLPVPDEDATALPPSREGRMPPPPVVVYQPRQTVAPRAQIIIVAPGGTSVVRRAPVVRQARVRTTYTSSSSSWCSGSSCPMRSSAWRSEWGINARIQGVGFGGDRNSNMAAARDAGMGGFGISLRYRPFARFAFDAGIDVIGGTDFNGFQRVETPFSLNGIFYFNPRSRSQFYVIGGVNWSRATVRSDNPSPLLTAARDGNGFAADYKYFGGQIGAGLEFRLSKRLAFNVDVLGFVRSRSDVDDDHHMKGGQTAPAKAPEYMNAATGQTTNTSGGGLFRGGLTLWW
jgi:hypothetical protein